METTTAKTPTWYWVVTILFILWNIMGVMSFIMHVFISEEALALLPDNERALYDEYPMWTTVMFGLAVGGGILGALGLVLRKSWAKLMALVSFIAIVIQMTHNVFMTSSIDVYGLARAVTMPILVVVFGALMYWFAASSAKKGWLS